MDSSERLASSSSSSSPSSAAPVVVAVLGATGFLGRLLVREASKAGYAVRAVVRPSSAEADVVAQLSKFRNVSVVRCETVTGAASSSYLPLSPPSSGSSSSSSSSAPLSVALSGCSAVLCALAGRNNTGGAEGVARKRAVEVDGIVSCFEAFLKSRPPPAPPPASKAFARRRFVAFAPPVRLLTRNGTRKPFSEYVVAKEEMERRLRLAAEAAFRAEAAEEEEAGRRRSGSGGGAEEEKVKTSPVAVAVAVSVFEVAAWGRDSAPIAAALLKSRASLVASGGANKLQPLDERDLAARVVRGLSLPRDVSANGPNPSPFTVISVGGPRVLTWRELVAEAGKSVGVEPLFVSVPRWTLEKLLVPAAELASRASGVSSGSGSTLSRAGYLARLAADVMATDLVAEEAVYGGGGGVEAKL